MFISANGQLNESSENHAKISYVVYYYCVNHTQIARGLAHRVYVFLSKGPKRVDKQDRVHDRVRVESKATDKNQQRRFERYGLSVPRVVYHEKRR